jgi:hypothetical protein
MFNKNKNIVGVVASWTTLSNNSKVQAQGKYPVPDHCHLPVKSSVLNTDPDWNRIQSGQWIRIRNPDPDPGVQKLPTKVEKIKKFHVLKCWLFSF